MKKPNEAQVSEAISVIKSCIRYLRVEEPKALETIRILDEATVELYGFSEEAS